MSKMRHGLDPIDTDKVLDSRDVEARIDELQGRADECDCIECAVCKEKTICAKCATCARCHDHAEGCEGCPETDPLDDEEKTELENLIDFREEAEGYCPDWHHGETLIRDDYFEEYAQELAADIGAIGRDAPWPADHIDWASAAEALKMDYSSADLDGVTYWFR
jgi:hypothetical protein